MDRLRRTAWLQQTSHTCGHPFFAEDHKLADSCRPLDNAHYTQCPYCKFTYGPHIPRWKGNTVKDVVNLDNMTLVKEMETVIEEAYQNQEKDREGQNCKGPLREVTGAGI